MTDEILADAILAYLETFSKTHDVSLKVMSSALEMAQMVINDDIYHEQHPRKGVSH